MGWCENDNDKIKKLGVVVRELGSWGVELSR
jgi:hypothetical protein